MNDFYVYMFVNHNTGSPVYVGKGCRQRDNQHKDIARCGNKRGHLYSWMRKYHSLNGVWPKPFRLLEGLTEQEAFDFERMLISFYGREDLRTGCLFNLTDGGDGTKGHAVTVETKEKIAKTLKEIRKVIPPANKGKKDSPEVRAKKCVSRIGGSQNKGRVPWNKGVPVSPETLVKISAALKGKVNKGRVCSAKHRLNISLAQKRRYEKERLNLAA